MNYEYVKYNLEDVPMPSLGGILKKNTLRNVVPARPPLLEYWAKTIQALCVTKNATIFRAGFFGSFPLG